MNGNGPDAGETKDIAGDLPVRPKRAKTGGRKRVMTVDALERLAKLNCTQAEIAAYFGISLTAVEVSLAEDANLRAAYDRGIQTGRLSIRRAQFRAADAGNPTMLIWLGKQLLGQKDRVETELSGSLDLRDDTHRAELESKLTRMLPRNAGSDSQVA